MKTMYLLMMPDWVYFDGVLRDRFDMEITYLHSTPMLQQGTLQMTSLCKLNPINKISIEN